MKAAALLRRLFTPISPGARRAVVMLFALSFALAAASMVFTALEVRASDHKFCDVVRGVTAVKVTRPASPARYPAQEGQWEWHERFITLGRSLGC